MCLTDSYRQGDHPQSPLDAMRFRSATGANTSGGREAGSGAQGRAPRETLPSSGAKAWRLGHMNDVTLNGGGS